MISKTLFGFLMMSKLLTAHRRIKGGDEVTTDNKFAVYLLKTVDSSVETHGWTCGGAIVSPNFVVTAAACIDDVEKLYVIAGYKKFVPALQLSDDKCTSKIKKRVIMTCIPKDYDLKYDDVATWIRADIGIVKVDTPFDSNDSSYELYCSYKPEVIRINFDPKYQEAGTDTLALGWGHTDKYRDDLDTNNYNAESLRYAPAKILDTEKCNLHFPSNKILHAIIENYIICTLDAGRLNDKGELIRAPESSEACISVNDTLKGKIGRMCQREKLLKTKKRNTIKTKKDEISGNKKKGGHSQLTIRVNSDEIYQTNDGDIKQTPGICQNDHGGPLVTWEGRDQILIGVATLFQVDGELNCVGPYLFTSTYTTRSFLQCILAMDNVTEASHSCKDAEEQQFEIIRRQISWNENDDI